MKKIIILILFCFLSFAMNAQSSSKVRVKGYTKKNGTYVAPHSRSAPNKSKKDNWSTKGNRNPVTHKKGTKKVKK